MIDIKNWRKLLLFFVSLGVIINDGVYATGGKNGLIKANAAAESMSVMPALSGLELVGVNLENDFQASNLVYWAYVDFTVASVKVNATYENSNYVLKIQDETAESGEQREVAVAEGYNTISIKLTDTVANTATTYFINIVRAANPETIYQEKTRPQVHFTPYRYQMNDPNGLVYNEVTGEYHLFFQTNRPFETGYSNLPGTTSWGHAVSTDLLSWTELPLAVLPDELGAAWSGSAVIDKNNTSGLFDESTPPGSRMVLFYASVGGDQTYGNAKISMAYSKDNGRTWIKYEGNPVVKNKANVYGGGLRDPKVIWFEDDGFEQGGIWVMVTVGDARLFTSHNLIDWKHVGRLKDKNGKIFDSECPDLFPLVVEETGETKWVFTGSGVFYIIGQLVRTADNKVEFIAESDMITPLNGISELVPGVMVPETYSTQTFYNDPHGRRIGISWIRDPMMEWKDKNWNSAQSIPMINTLRLVDGEIRLFHYPVDEINAARVESEKVVFENVKYEVGQDNPLKGISSTLCDIETTIQLGTATEVGFRLRKGSAEGGQELVITYNRLTKKLSVDKTASGSGTVGITEANMSLLDGDTITLRMMLDQICFDVYGNLGEVAIAGLIYSELENNEIEFFANGTATIQSFTLYPLDRDREAASSGNNEADHGAGNSSGVKSNFINKLFVLLLSFLLSSAVLGGAALVMGRRKAKRKNI